VDTKWAGEQGEREANLHISQNEIRNYITIYIYIYIYIYITSLMKKTKVHVTLQSLPQYQAFSKPKEQGKDPKIKTCTHHRCGDTTNFSTRSLAGGIWRRKGKIRAKGRGKRGGGAAHKTSCRHDRNQTAHCKCT
jgi:hypothetical protein